jgi:hypothetical protein
MNRSYTGPRLLSIIFPFCGTDDIIVYDYLRMRCLYEFLKESIPIEILLSAASHIGNEIHGQFPTDTQIFAGEL